MKWASLAIRPPFEWRDRSTNEIFVECEIPSELAENFNGFHFLSCPGTFHCSNVVPAVVNSCTQKVSLAVFQVLSVHVQVRVQVLKCVFKMYSSV